MRRGKRLRFRRTTLMLVGCLAFLLGVGVARSGYSVGPYTCLASLGLLIVGLRRRGLITLVLTMTFCACLGLWRGSVYVAKLNAYQPLYFQPVDLVAQAENDAVYDKNSQLSFEADHIQLADGTTLTGHIEVAGFGLNSVYEGDTIAVSGKLYPALGAYQGRVSFARLQLIDRRPTLVTDLRQHFTAGMQSALPEPVASFAMGLLIGQRATLPANIKQDLLEVGLTHIIAVSGYNLTIMLHASKTLLSKRSKRLSTSLAFGLIAIFLLLAGLSASIVRAAIVSTLSILADYYGRSFKPLNLIALAAAITAWLKPFYVWSDTSWYLSFLAFFGVMVLAPLVTSHLQPRWRESLILTVAVESFCAETMTLPFVLHVFGQISYIGLLANVLVVTLVPLAMLFSLIAGLGGMSSIGLISGWLAWPARFLLTYMLDIAHLLTSLPHVFMQNIGLSLSGMLTVYVSIVLVTAVFWSRTKQPVYAKITDNKEASQQEFTP